jgi:hypothetical protein
VTASTSPTVSVRRAGAHIPSADPVGPAGSAGVVAGLAVSVHTQATVEPQPQLTSSGLTARPPKKRDAARPDTGDNAGTMSKNTPWVFVDCEARGISPVNDAMGNVEAFEEKMRRAKGSD